MISVIIPTRNRSSLLQGVLNSLLRQELKSSSFEILVVDNGSTDNTSQVLDEFSRILDNLNCILEPVPGLHMGRHAGMKAARSDILVFADDDIEALPTWLSSIEEAFRDPKVAMVGGNNYPLFMQSPPDWLARMWNRQTFRGYKSIPSLSVIEFTQKPIHISPFLVWGCNFAIRKDVLLQAGGFHPDGMPKELIRFRGDGETHVSRHVADSGLKCVFHSGASVHHKITPERMTHDYFRQRGFNQGVSDSYTRLRSNDFNAASARRPFAKRALGFAMRTVLNLLDSAETRRVAAEWQLGHREGYAYHQATYRDDPEVRDWVHRSTYY